MTALGEKGGGRRKQPQAPTIALSGGWTRDGRHSVLSPVYGLGAGRVVEVLPDFPTFGTEYAAPGAAASAGSSSRRVRQEVPV